MITVDPGKAVDRSHHRKLLYLTTRPVRIKLVKSWLSKKKKPTETAEQPNVATWEGPKRGPRVP